MEDELKYWMNDDTGRVIAMENSPGRLWFEIDFETYDALTHPGAKAVEHSVQRTPLECAHENATPVLPGFKECHDCGMTVRR